MKVETRQNKKTGEMYVEYVNVIRKPGFRYCLLKKIIESMDTDITILIDTNQRIASIPVKQVEDCLRRMNLRYRSVPIESNPRRFFGIPIPVNKKRLMGEHKIVLELSGNALPRELFDQLSNFDIAFGFGKKKPFEDTCGDFRMDNALVLFNAEYFRDSVYDSVVCETLRSSFDVEPLVRETENEMAV